MQRLPDQPNLHLHEPLVHVPPVIPSAIWLQSLSEVHGGGGGGAGLFVQYVMSRLRRAGSEGPSMHFLFCLLSDHIHLVPEPEDSFCQDSTHVF